MKEKPSTLEQLEELVKEHKIKSLKLSKSSFAKHYVTNMCDSFISLINQLKESEKEQSRIDWKDGYIHCVLDFGEFLGNERDCCFPNKQESEIIDKLSFEFIEIKNKK
jgi:hypothetical protein